MRHIPVLLNDVLKTLGSGSPPLGGCLGECQNGVVYKPERKTQNYLSLPYNPKLVDRAKALRKTGTLPEALLWKEIKNGRINGLDFDRQKIIGNYIVDFFCASHHLVVEIDDKESHDFKETYDAARDDYLKSLGLVVIHIAAIDVLKNMDSVIARLVNHPGLSPHAVTRPPLHRRGTGTEPHVGETRIEPYVREVQITSYNQQLSGKIIVDCTFGAGGYTRALLERGASVIAFDRDPNVIGDAEKIANEYPGRFRFINKPFSEIGDAIHNPDTAAGPRYDNGADAIVFDLGISSMQIDNGDRGFSFRFDGPLDMRMSGNQESGIRNQTATELIDNFAKNKNTDGLARLLRDYGDIKNPRGLAQKMIDNLPQTTFELKKLIGNPRDVAPVFQALRIAVNDEMGQIQTALDAVPALLKPGGICICVTFHSLEDRIVKNIFRDWTTRKGDPRIPVLTVATETLCPPGYAPFKLLKTIKPSADELENNPRARSAHLRAVQKVSD